MSGEPAGSASAGLNANHKRVLAATFAHLAHSFGAIEAAMEDTSSPIAKYVDDLAAERRALLRDHLQRLRERLTTAMHALELRPPERIPISRALHVALTHAQIALDELSPRRLRGYGLVDGEIAERVATVLSDLDRGIRRIATDLARPDSAALAARISRVHSDAHRERLARVERIVTKHGLVELRPAIEGLVELLEVRTFEVALFGRVSCGKSSLINAVLGGPVLPVGVTPITAVPTRVRWGEVPRALIRLADGSMKEGGLSLLHESVTEAGNPNNRRGVVRATVELPSAPLLGRVVLVDTPGIGSLAAHGTRETLGYLPRADLGVLLIEASSAVGRDEIDLLRRLDESGIDAQVVLSKADLVAASEREHVRAYFAHEIANALGRAVPVDLASAAEAQMSKAWFADRVGPLASRASDLIVDSANRKLVAIETTAIAILRAIVEQTQRPAPGTSDEIERLALAAEGLLRTTGEHAELLVNGLGSSTERVIRAASHNAHAATSDVRDAIVAAIRDEADGARSLVEADLSATRAKLRDLLLDLSRVARVGLEVPALRLDLASQPVLDVPEDFGAANLTMPHWPAIERRLASRIESTVGDTMRALLDGYARGLQTWTRGVLADLATQVGAYVEPCRALAHVGPSAHDEISEDLRTLERL